MAGIAYCIPPHLYEKLKSQGLLDVANEGIVESNTEKTLAKIPLALKGSAEFIVENLGSNFEILPDLSFKYKSRTVPSSDIRDLLVKLVTQDPQLYDLPGSIEFVDAVKSNVPSHKYKLPTRLTLNEKESGSPSNNTRYDSSQWLRFEDKYNLA